MRSTVAVIVGIILLLLLYQFGAKQKAPDIEADIRNRSAAAVADSGFSNVAVSTDGRDVTLTGTVADEPGIGRVEQVARDVWGVRVVANEVEVAEQYAIEICTDESRVTAKGSAPSQAAVNQILARIEELFHRRTSVESLGARPDAPPQFSEFVDEMLGELAQLDVGCLTTEGRQATLAGAVHGQDAAQRIRSNLAAVEKLGFTVSLNLDVPSLSDEAAACQAEYNRRLAPGERVLFDFDSAELHNEGRQLLDEIVEIGESCPDVRVWVAGHTDSVGDREYNIRLSQERADVVVEYLVSKGVDRDRLTAVGYGYSQPVADNSTDEGRAQNRRIEFRVRED
jgi:OmpA-OmpF porin, OOP family